MAGDATIARVRWRPWAIPFRTAFGAASGAYRDRSGVIIVVEDADGVIGIGEASPLPEHSGGSVDEVLRLLRADAAPLVGRTADDALARGGQATQGPGPSAAALRCGLECALLDLQARQKDTPFGEQLRLAAGLQPRSPREAVSVNATIDAIEPDTAGEMADATVREGFRTIKVKVGTGLAGDLARLEAVRAAAGDEIELRIDANGAWDDDGAREALCRLRVYDVALCEQPLAPGRADVVAATARVGRETRVPVALDESCRTLKDVRAIVTTGGIDAVVIKPSLIGIMAAAKMMDVAEKSGLDCIVTSAFETSIGTLASARVAALRRGSAACGLATVDLLSDDLGVPPLLPRGGVINLPAGPGPGMVLDEDALERRATGPWEQRP